MATDTLADLDKIEKKPSSKQLVEDAPATIVEPELVIRTSQAGSALGNKPAFGLKPKMGGGSAFSRPALGGSKATNQS